MRSMLSAGLAGGVAGSAVWWLAMLRLRRANWSAPTKRRADVRGGDKRSEELKYHNEAIYRDFEYFFKVTLAVLGGIAFVVTKDKVRADEVTKVLLSAAGALQLVAGVVFALFIFFHQKSKIERWEDYFSWGKPFTWQECWMVSSMFAISSGVAFGAVPDLLVVLARVGSGS
jgi:hypothetical protein